MTREAMQASLLAIGTIALTAALGAAVLALVALLVFFVIRGR